MLKSFLAVEVPMFDANCRITLVGEDLTFTDLGHVPVSILNELLVENCYKYNTNTIKLFGEPKYLSQIANDIQEYNLKDNEFNHSGKRKIEVEIHNK